MLLSIHHSMLCSSSSLVSAKTLALILCSVMSRWGTCIPHFPASSLLDFASKRYSWEITGGQREATPCLLGLADIPLTAATASAPWLFWPPSTQGVPLVGKVLLLQHQLSQHQLYGPSRTRRWLPSKVLRDNKLHKMSWDYSLFFYPGIVWTQLVIFDLNVQ